MSRIFLGSLLFLALSHPPAQAAVVGKVIHYKAGDTELVGYIAYDDAVKGKRPGVIVVPDWWGHGEFIRDRARALAKLGYTSMVMDSYGGGTYVEPPDQAGKLRDQLIADPAAMRARFLATKDTLLNHETVGGQVAAIGYSLGGLIVIEMARQGVALDGVASLWGSIRKPDNPAKKGAVKAKLLIQQPENDAAAPMEEVNRLKKEMTASGAEIKLIVYPGTTHGFSRPDATERATKYDLPLRYNADADKKSWDDLSVFLKEVFKKS